MTGTAKGGAGPNGGQTRSYKEGAVLPPAGTTAGSVQAPDAVGRVWQLGSGLGEDPADIP